MATQRIAMSYVYYDTDATGKSPNPQVLIEFFSSEEDDAELAITVSYNPATREYDRCDTVDDLDADGKQNDADREICIDLAQAFIHAMNQMNPPDIDIR